MYMTFLLIIVIHLAKKTQIILLLMEKSNYIEKIFGFYKCFFRKKSFNITKNNKFKLIRY